MIDKRAAYPDSTLADLYDPLTMPADLYRAHVDLDRLTDGLYGRGTFDEVKRLATLLKRYAALSSLQPKKVTRRTRAARPAEAMKLD